MSWIALMENCERLQFASMIASYMFCDRAAMRIRISDVSRY